MSLFLNILCFAYHLSISHLKILISLRYVWTTLEWHVLNISEPPAREKIESTVISYYISSFHVYLQELPIKMQIGCSESGMGASACLQSSLMLLVNRQHCEWHGGQLG